MPHFIALLARACEMAGQIEEAMTLPEEPFQIAEKTGEGCFAAALNRHKGQLLLPHGHFEAADGLVSRRPEHRPGAGSQVLGIARRRKPRPVLPRPSLTHRSPRPSCAALRLGSPEGFDTPDLLEVRRGSRRSMRNRLPLWALTTSLAVKVRNWHLPGALIRIQGVGSLALTGPAR